MAYLLPDIERAVFSVLRKGSEQITKSVNDQTMTNQKKSFHFTLPVPNQTHLVGEIEVKGIGSFHPYCEEERRFMAEIKEIIWNGTDIKPLLDYNTFGWTDEGIWEAALEHVTGMFESEEELEDNRRMEEDQDYQDAQEMILETQKTL